MSRAAFNWRELLRQMGGSSGLLALFAVIGGGALALTHAGTADRIREQEAFAAERGARMITKLKVRRARDLAAALFAAAAGPTHTEAQSCY